MKNVVIVGGGARADIEAAHEKRRGQRFQRLSRYGEPAFTRV